MRDIEYRAFVKKDKKMLPVTDLCFNETEAVGVSGCGNANCTLCVDWYSFDDVVLMQYTGLKDKSDNKIFEGDIVDISVYDRLDWSSIKGKVVFLNGAWLVEDVGHFAITLQSETNEIEIIGNVHENLGLWEA
ncbi:hypothetical protein N0812_001142 [Listeria monocytogenes]|uniref:YopX family protein n=1 Tax=Listeria monocytogenes TaxID=1639 RepID=UPI0008F5A025|nr:YopX family protein [Listeria monocytogenes]EAD0234499.1 hypothetical protein [Listeria monocytogenes]EGA9846883.1 hypothetical protein [Listeria monocytogenes]EJP4627573.1 hypothetical protein [Listeria monocytogenes]EJR8953161.1 hypothetical protein [Listeria monocytogenes]OIJ48240.1 hypothetical protein BKM68_05160 [Listeria monocytogenes]